MAEGEVLLQSLTKRRSEGTTANSHINNDDENEEIKDIFCSLTQRSHPLGSATPPAAPRQY